MESLVCYLEGIESEEISYNHIYYLEKYIYSNAHIDH